MLYVLYGNDAEKARAKTNSLVASLCAKKPDATLVRLTSEGNTQAVLEEHIGGQGLFEAKLIVVCDFLLGGKEGNRIVGEKITEMAASQNIFILLEEKIEKQILTKLIAYAEKVQVCEQNENIVRSATFNVFSLSDAFGRRNARELWILYQKGKRARLTPEEMLSTLFWGVKALRLAKESKSPEGAGLHPFVYRKASQFAKNYSTEELEKLSLRLVMLYHDARRGVHSLDAALEQFVLAL
jgi:hypothetical protein